MPDVMTGPVDLAAIRRLYEVSARITAGRGLQQTLQAVVDGVVDALGFGVAVVNYRHCDGTFETIAVAGPQAAREALVGTRSPSDTFDVEFDRAEQWGRLRFVPHDRLQPEELTGWVPDVAVLDVPDAWHPLDALFAPLTTPDGDLVGMLSVDLPHDGRRPGAGQREMLELFAMQAGIAIGNVRLTEALQGEREQLRHEQARLRASEAAFRLAFEGAANGMAIVDLDAADLGRFLRVNEALCRMTGHAPQSLLATHVHDVVHAEDAAASRQALEAAASGVRPRYRAERRFLRPDATVVWLSITAAVIRPDEDLAPFMLIHVEDVTDRRAAESLLRHTAGHDELTGLPNRRLLMERLTAAQDRAQRTRRPGAVLFCDLDGFKRVNDELGHAAGDHVLRQVADRLRLVVRSRDTVARLGGDEFVVVAEDIDDAALRDLTDRLRAAVAEPIEGVPAALTVSVGTAALTHTVPDARHLLARADHAMYRAKSRSRGRGPGP